MSYQGKSPNVNRLRLNPRSSDPVSPLEGDLQYADGSAREEGLWVYKNGAWEKVGADVSGSINYIVNGGAEAGATTGWATYADAAAAVPVDGTGGSPNITFAVTSTPGEVLRGSRSFKLTKDAANRQGQGVSYDLPSLDLQDYERSKNLIVKFNYKTSANFASNDIRVFAYDRDTSTLLNVQSLTGDGSLAASSTATSFTGSFQSVSSSNDYRLIIHIASTNALAYDVIVDDVVVTPDMSVPGAIVTPWESWTPTGTWSTNTAYTGRYRRVGDSLEADVTVSLSGAPTGTFTVNLPSGLTIDTSKLSNTSPLIPILGTLDMNDNALSQYYGYVVYNSTTSVAGMVFSAGGTYVANVQVSATVPVSFNTSDTLSLTFKVPIVGWAASAALSTTETMLSTVRARYTSASSATVSTAAPVDYETRVFDTNNCVTTGSSWRFTAPKSAYYKVYAQYYVNGAPTAALYKNGSAVSSGTIGSTTNVTTIDDTIYLVAGDYIDIRSASSSFTLTNAALYAFINIEEDPNFSIFSVYGVTEYTELKQTSFINWAITAGQYGDLGSTTLQPGEYDVVGYLNTQNNGAVTTNQLQIGVSTTSGNSGAGLEVSNNVAISSNIVQASGGYNALAMPGHRIVVTSPTLVYVKGFAGSSITNLQYTYSVKFRKVK